MVGLDAAKTMMEFTSSNSTKWPRPSQPSVFCVETVAYMKCVSFVVLGFESGAGKDPALDKLKVHGT